MLVVKGIAKADTHEHSKATATKRMGKRLHNAEMVRRYLELAENRMEQIKKQDVSGSGKGYGGTMGRRKGKGGLRTD